MSLELTWAKDHSRTSASPSVSMAVFQRIEGERDQTLLEVKQLRAEKTSLQTRLKVLQGTQLNDLNSLEGTMGELRAEKDKVCEERENLIGRLQCSKELLASLQLELEGTTTDLAAANTEIVAYQRKVSQLQALVEASEKSRLVLSTELREREGSVEQSHTTETTFNRRIGEVACVCLYLCMYACMYVDGKVCVMVCVAPPPPPPPPPQLSWSMR